MESSSLLLSGDDPIEGLDAGIVNSAAAAPPPPDYTNINVRKARFRSSLAALLDDPILADVSKNPTFSDVDTLISLSLEAPCGSLSLNWTDLVLVALMNSATVKNLRLAIQKKVDEIEQSQMGHRHISWEHVGKNLCLSFHNEKLLDDNSILESYGIRSNSQVQFVPYVKARAIKRHSKRRKHRFLHSLKNSG